MGTHYSHITKADRISIQPLVQAKLSGREIGRQLNLIHSCISRELSRSKSKPTAATSSYQAGVAHVRARARRVEVGAARRKLGVDLQTPLWRIVLNGLLCNWSPEQIAGKLPAGNKPTNASDQSPTIKAMTVSHETVYCAIYAMPRGTLRAELISLLRQSHKTRLPNYPI